MIRHDLTGDSRADIIVTSPWGLGVLGVLGGGVVQHTIAANGTRLGEWLLNTQDNNVELRADVDGDGVAELLMSSPWGIGVLKMVGRGLKSIAMGQNGRRFGGWIIDTSNNQFLHAGDVDGDGRDELLVTSPWGIGLMKLVGELTTLMLAPNGTRFGNWLLNTDDNTFPIVADVDGDGRAEVVVTSPWGLGILKVSGAGLTSIVMAPNGTSFGDWILETAVDSIEAAADLDGDGRRELVIRNPGGVAVLRYDGGALRTLARADSGADLGGWLLDAARDRLGVTGDLDGDRRAEMIVTGDQGIALVGVDGSRLRTKLVSANGTRFGGWLLNTRDNRIAHAADFDGDGRDELLVSSPWGMGVIEHDGGSHLRSLTMWQNGTRFGDWLLNTADNDLEAGLGQSWALLVWHPDWSGAINSTRDVLRRRGYAVVDTSDVQQGLTRLRRLALVTRPSDRVFVYLAGHGATGRPLTDTSRETSATHILQFGDGSTVRYDQFTPSFRRIAGSGAELSVLDGSCDGGEAVMDAIGQRYLALSTTAIHAPGITNTPNPGDLMSRAGKPNSFGLWWSREPTASLMTAQVPHRFYQKIFRSDDTDISRWSLFYKPGITFYQAVGGSWDLMVRHCYLYRYVYPDGYAKLTADEKALMTVTADAYLTDMREDLNALAPAITALRGILGDAALVGRAADVYAAAYPTPWRTLFGDLTWNVDAEPVRKSPIGTDIEPRRYAGRDGFLRMAADILATLTLFAQSYDEQERLLRALDREIRHKDIYTDRFTDRVALRPSPTPTDYLKFNKVDEWQRERSRRLLERVGRPELQIATRLRELSSALARTDEVGRAEWKAQDVGHAWQESDERARGPEPHGLRQTRYDRLFANELRVIAGSAIIAALHPSVDNLVARITAMQATDGVLLDQLFYLLTIAEEAISRASARGAEVGDLVSF